MPWTVSVGGRAFAASIAEPSRRATPVRRAGLRGGAYHSGTEAERLECTVKDRSILPLLTPAMLGPSQDFEPITAESDDGRRLTGRLASYVESGGEVRLSLLL